MKLKTVDELNAFLDRTTLFQQDVAEHLSTLEPIPVERHLIAYQAGALSIEHGLSILMLIQAGFHTSAMALMRPQFESLLRGVWLLYAASEGWVEKLSQPLTHETANSANKAPMVADMLTELEGENPAPRHIVSQLREFQRETGKALNSFTHGGLHPLSRSAHGYPAQLIYDVMRNANAVTALTGQLVVVLTADPSNMVPLRQLHVTYADCLHIIGPEAAQGAGSGFKQGSV